MCTYKVKNLFYHDFNNSAIPVSGKFVQESHSDVRKTSFNKTPDRANQSLPGQIFEKDN